MSRERLRVGCAGLLAGLVFVAEPADADGEQCRLERLPKENKTEFPLLYQPRHDEFTFEARYLGSSLPVHSALGVALMYSFAPLDQRLHLGLRVGGTFGSWGSDERGAMALGLGARAAYDVARPMSGVFDVYLLAQADALAFAAHGDPVLRPGVGMGLRVARTIGAEASFDPLVSLGGAFAHHETVVGGFGVGLLFDLCAVGAWCDERPRISRDHDLTQELYAAAALIVPPDPTKHRALCDAVSLGLDATRYFPHDKIDSTEAFLRGVVENLTDAATKADVQALEDKHVAWRKQQLTSHDAARLAARADVSLEEHCIYEPFPVEIRTAFGCP